MSGNKLSVQLRVLAGNTMMIVPVSETGCLAISVAADGPDGVRALRGLFDSLWAAVDTGGTVEVGCAGLTWPYDTHGVFVVKVSQGQCDTGLELAKYPAAATVRREYAGGGRQKMTFCALPSVAPSEDDPEDLLRAYDCYIQSAFEARLPDSGWCPVCVREFAEHEYEDVWLCREEGEDPFAYMYGGSGGE